SSNSYGISLADLDGDGDIDAFVANYNGQNKVWLNNTDLNLSFSATPANCDSTCDGTASVMLESSIFFNYLWDDPNAQTTDTAVGLCEGTYNVTVTDANNCVTATGGVAVYCTNPAPTCAGLFPFETDINGLVTEYTTSINWGDFDNDGDLDAVITANSSDSKIFLNDGMGSFTLDQYLSHPDGDTYDAATGDIDLDGDIDIVIIGHSNNAVYLNDGTGQFVNTGQNFTFGSYLFEAIDELKDLDGDGDLDMFITNSQHSEVWLNNGFGFFTNTGQSIGDFTNSSNVVLGDIDGDGDVDAVTAGGYCEVFLNDGTGNFTPQGYNIQSYGSAFDLGDIDNDGDLDLVGSTIWFNDGLGNFSDSWQANIPNGDIYKLGDFDNDNDLDLYIAENYNLNYLFLNNGSGYFVSSGQIINTNNDDYSHHVSVGDLNGDGYLDITNSNYDDGANPSILFNQSSPTLSSSTSTPTCNGFTNGTANVQVNVATAPYNYQWSNGATTSFISGIEAGVYTVTVTDALGCSDSLEVVVAEPEIIIELDPLPNFYCNGFCEGGVVANVSGGNNLYTFMWDDPLVQTSSTANNLCAGTYTVSVTNAIGCTQTESLAIAPEAYPQYPICLISVDNTSTKNLVVWEKPLSPGIDSVKIYREFGTNNYGLVGIVSNDSLSQFTDNSFGINPNITSYRYKISLLDSCGNESQVSSFHETMHLSTNLAPNGDVNLIWDAYEGFPVIYYRILRDSTFSNSWQVMDSVSSNVFIWTDINPPTAGADYIVEVIAPFTCTANKAQDHNSTRSNRANALGGGAPPVGDFTANITQINIGGIIDFFDQSINNPVSWTWYFSGGSPGFSTQQNPSAIIYNTPGIYDVKLVVINALGIDTLVKTGYIEVVPGAGLQPSCDFLATSTQINEGESVGFMDLTLNIPTTWSWLFPGGNPAFSLTQNPAAVTYNTPGIYDVKLVVSNPSGADTLIKTAYIEVLPGGGNSWPITDFIASATQVPGGTPVEFMDQTQNNPTSWSWLFPGGNPAFSMVQHPVDITYNTAGTYDVTLVTVNVNGTDTLVKTNYIEVTSTIGVQEYKEGKVSIYPNPANDRLTVELTQIELPCFFALKDMQGRTVYSTVVNSEKLEIDLSAYAKGIYLIRVNNANFSRELKLVKQ
ncbi:FG-GAP-like repeat-containing protein, partial [Flavobacteriales bacterium]|nr:FG-GAP-like repeat-containing protein [Flavobacteriales bacterium]